MQTHQPKRYRVGLIGYGGMGRNWARELARSPRWELAAICDLAPDLRDRATTDYPQSRITASAADIFSDPSLDAVGLFTLADARPPLIERALAAGKHILAEKPLAADVPGEERLLAAIEGSDRQVAVNLFNRNAWYHKEAQAFIASGQIGELAIVRTWHQTPGLRPYERSADEALPPEGEPFHDCGMHYVDVARWYANSEYVPGQYDAQGLSLWGVEHPWWINAHGVFANGVVFDITQGFCYGQLAQEPSESCGLEAIGTLGFVRFRHDFQTVSLEMHGTSQTIHKSGPYGSKKIDVMVEVFARSLDAGRNLGYPTARDSVIASRVSAEMVQQVRRKALPMKGTRSDLERILRHAGKLREREAALAQGTTPAKPAGKP